MNPQSHAQLQGSYREWAYRFAPYLTIAATLTLKTYAKVQVRRVDNYDGGGIYEFGRRLSEETLRSTLKHFTDRLTHLLYGNMAKHKNKKAWAKPLILFAIEGRNTHKHTHLHIAIGNIPEEKLPDIAQIIERAWLGCDFANKEICVKPLTNNRGWLDYMTKEVGYTDNDALAIEHICVPEIIQDRICTESRLP